MEHRVYKDVILASLYHLFQPELKDKEENGIVQQESKEGYELQKKEIVQKMKKRGSKLWQVRESRSV